MIPAAADSSHLSEGPVGREAPAWLAARLQAAGGRVSFRQYMEWALHDPEHGAYGSGRLRIGPRGDFATAPSLGPDFAGLVAVQLIDWLEALAAEQPGPIALVETGPGEGDLARELAGLLAEQRPDLAARTELVLVEPNPGMAERQRQCLADAPLAGRWVDWPQLAAAPVRGVVLAHEVLDALAVERIVSDGTLWRRQELALRQGTLRLEPGEPLEPEVAALLVPLDLASPGPQRSAGWCSELHPGLPPWLEACGRGLARGQLLVIDYAHEARRYYAPQRSAGTLMAYRAQQASGDPLRDPGHWDLTAHLCLESLEAAAQAAGWRSLGQRRQGEALLALGLAERLHGLQQLDPAGLAMALQRREALLRLADPHTLGDFRWVAFERGGTPPSRLLKLPRFLRDPAP